MKKLIPVLFFIFAFAPGLVSGEETKLNPKDIAFFVDPVPGPERLEFEISLKNHSQSPAKIVFPSSQKFEIIVENKKGEEVYRFSKDKFFTQALEGLELKANESMTWTDQWNYMKDGKRVEEGEYIVKAELKATKVNGVPLQQRFFDSKQTYIPKEHPAIKNVKVQGSKGNYTVTGKARPLAGKLFYTVEDGHNELVAETAKQTKTKYPDWSEFAIEVKLPENKLPENGTLILNLYEREQKENKIIHVYPVVLEKFY